MADDKRAYYIAAGDSLAQVNSIIAQRKLCNVHRDEFCKKIGATNLITLDRNNAIIGAVFSTPPGPAWRNYGKSGRFTAPDDWYRPRKNTKAGKAMAKEMQSLAWYQDDLVARSFIDNRSATMYYGNIQRVGDQYIISQHENLSPPDGAIPLKLSEYYALKEAQESTETKEPK